MLMTVDMANLNYRILFEVKILHDFYLSQPNGGSYFHLPANTQKDVLDHLIAIDSYDVRKDLRFVPTELTNKLLKNHQMVLIPTQTGFFVGGHIDKSLNDADEEVFHLSIPFSTPTRWEFTILPDNLNYRSFTNVSLKSALTSIFLFSNQNGDDSKIMPSLAQPVRDFENGKTYQMGNLAIISGNLNQAIKRTSVDNDGWVILPADHRWVNESDRVLLPMSFHYLVSQDGINEIGVKLKNTDDTLILDFDTSNEEIKRSFTTSGAIKDIIIDFNLFPEQSIDVGHYVLEITENAADTFSYNVYLDDELYMPNAIGGIVIHSHDEGTNSAVLDDTGQLIRTNDSHPIFEIRFKNRVSYWRYRSRQKVGLKAENDAITFLDEIDNDLQTKLPVSLQQLPLQFEDGATKVFLPNPDASMVKQDGEGRLYTDIFISEVEGLIVNN